MFSPVVYQWYIRAICFCVTLSCIPHIFCFSWLYVLQTSSHERGRYWGKHETPHKQLLYSRSLLAICHSNLVFTHYISMLSDKPYQQWIKVVFFALFALFVTPILKFRSDRICIITHLLPIELVEADLAKRLYLNKL